MTTVITVACQKGGVGKTTTAITLAHGLALKGHDTLLIDLDPQGQSAVALGISPDSCVFTMLANGKITKESLRFAREKLHIIPGDKQTMYAQILLAARNDRIDYLSNVLKPYTKNGLRYIVFDTSPSVGGIQERALYAADLVIIPTATDFLSADAVAHTIATMEEHDCKGGMWVLPTFYDDTTRESAQTMAELQELYGDQVLEPIHRATVLRECAAEGVTIWEKNGDTRAGKEYSRLLYRVLGAK